NFSISRWYAAPVGSHVSNNDPKILEKEKEKTLKVSSSSKEKVNKSRVKHAPGWNELLASDSEAIIKAERGHGHDINCSIEELQRQSVATFHEDRKN
ncbi:7955_t:CDS:2, partial [Ambispora leptoticha]